MVDLLGLYDSRAQRISVLHLVLNLAFVAVQACNFWLRMEEGRGSDVLPRAISIVAVAALIASGRLGGHLVHVDLEPGTSEVSGGNLDILHLARGRRNWRAILT